MKKTIRVTHLHPYLVKGSIWKVARGIRIKFHVPAISEYVRAK